MFGMFGSYEDKDYQDALVASVGVEVGVDEGVLGGDGPQLDLALVSLADDLVVASARKLEAFCYF